MNKTVAAVGCALFALSCAGEPQDRTPKPIMLDECEGLPAVALTLSADKVRVGSAVTLFAEGGSGRFRYEVDPGGSGGELRDRRYVAGLTPGSDTLRASDDCDNSASAVLQVVAGFDVAPLRASVRPGTSFKLEIDGNLGEVSCSARTLASGGTISGNCQYGAGPREGLDVITVHDAGSGDDVVAQYDVSASSGLRGAPSRLALPAGGSLTLETRGGSDSQSFAKISGPCALDAAALSCDAGAQGTAVIEATDRFTGEKARIHVQLLEELGHADKPHGRLSDLASVVTGDFDGDGSEDIALGVPESDLGRPSGGAVFIFKGGAGGMPSQPTWTLTGETDTANLGALLAAGDLNGDGRAELAVSEPGADITVADSGAVLIYTWTDKGPALLRPALTGIGPSKFGAALAIADADGDGDRDLIVGSPNADLAPASSIKERGVVDVFLLDEGEPIPDVGSVRIGGSDLNAAGALKASASLRFGRSLAVGDFNGDGRADIASLGAVNNAKLPDLTLAENQPAIALHFGRAASPPFAATPDVYLLPVNPQDGDEGSYRLFSAPAADGGKAERLLVAIDRLDAPDLSTKGGNKAAADAGGVYVFELRDMQPAETPPLQPTQLGRSAAFARIYGDAASGFAGRSLALADLDGDGKLELVLGAPNAARAKEDKTTSALTGKLLVYPYATLSAGSELNQASAVRWGQGAVDTFGVAVAQWSPGGAHGLVAFAGRASTELGDFTGRLDAYLGSGALADRSAQSAAIPARLASQQRGAAVALGVIDGELRALVGAPGFSGLGSKGDGDDINAGRALLYTHGESSGEVVHEGAASAHHAAYGGRSIGSDVAMTDFDGDGRADLVLAAPQLATPTANNTDYDQLPASCVTPSAQGNGGALVFLSQPGGGFRSGFRALAVADIAGCTPAGDAACKRRELARFGVAGGFDFDGDGKQDLMLTRANGLEIFLGRAAGSSGKPSLACDPAFSLPALPQAVSAPAALGDLDADGCDEVALRYAGNNRSGVLILFGFAAGGGRCKGHNQAAWLRVSGDAEVGLNNLQLGIASARAGRVFGDARDCVAISAGLYPFAGARQPAVLLFDAAELAKLRPASGEAVIGALSAELRSWPIVYTERAPGFGRALAGNADLDGDGIVDLVVSAPGASINGDGTGAVFGFRGGASFGGAMAPWLTVLGDPRERANPGQDLALAPATASTPASLAIGAPLSYRTGTANGTAWLLPLTAAEP